MNTSAQAAPTTTTTPIMSSQQNELLNYLMPQVRQFAATVPQRYTGETVAGFDPAQTEAQRMALSGAQSQDEAAKNALSTYNYYTTGGVWDPSRSNVGGAIDAAVRPITQQLTESTLPALRGEAITTGNYGGSRQGIAEGLASGRASTATGDTAAKISEDLYRTNVEAELRALGLTPTIQAAQTAGAQTTGAVGDVRQAMAQRYMDEQRSNFYFDQNAPFLQAQELASIYGVLPTGGVQSVGSVPPTNRLAQAIGGGMTGAAAGSLFGPIGTGVGAIGGAALPFLLNR